MNSLPKKFRKINSFNNFELYIYLQAEYLFRENPEGKMFQPDYFERGEELAKTLEEVKHWKEDARSVDVDSFKDTETLDESIVSDAISNVSEINRQCFGIEKVSEISLVPSKKESEDERISEKPGESSYGSCSCSSTLSCPSSEPTPPATICKCPPYSSSSSTSRSSKSGEKSLKSVRLKCRCK